MRKVSTILVAGLIAAIICLAAVSIIIFRQGEMASKESGSRAIMRAAAESVRYYFSLEGKLPRTLNDISEGDPIMDLFDKPLEYRIDTEHSNRFSIFSHGITSKSNLFECEIRGTNLIVIRIE